MMRHSFRGSWYGLGQHATVSLVFVVAVMSSSAAWATVNYDVPKATPTIDGTITAAEMASQLAFPMSWPTAEGFLALSGAGTGIDDLSADWYLSWDENNLNISAVVRDNTPDFRVSSGGSGNVPYNGQDVIQPVFNPNNNPAHQFPPDDGTGGPAAIYDMVVDTSDGFGPDIFRHGDFLSAAEHASITIDGQKTASGYILEASIPWATAMDAVDPSYVPQVNDVHGLGFILVSFQPDPDALTLYTDFADWPATSWNKITLVPEPSAFGLLCLGGWALLLGRRRRHHE